MDATSTGGSPQTLLLLEDEDAVRRLVATVLESAGYRVLQAADAVTALTLAQSFPGRIHLLISDMTMPDMDGREVARTVTRMRPDCGVLLISGYPADPVPQRGSASPVPAFLQKPFVPRVLLERVRELIESSSA